MANARKEPFEWKELADIFCIREGECKGEIREKLMLRVNGFTDKYGREYVIKKIALRPQSRD